MILAAFFSLMGLLVVHELSHFLLAKRFGVKVEEFGIGYPPKIASRQFKGTAYSLNWLPFGAFVRFPDEKGDDPGKLSLQPIYKRIIVILGGVVSFWVIASLLFSAVFMLGTRISIDDSELATNPQIQIVGVSKASPAEEAGLAPGDFIKEMKSSEKVIDPVTISEVQEFTKENLGEEIEVVYQRVEEISSVKIVPRLDPPQNEGALGISLARTEFRSYPFFTSLWLGPKTTYNVTRTVIEGYLSAIGKLFSGEPTGVEAVGPIGIIKMTTDASQLGFGYFVQFIAMISVYLAVFNSLPIPVADGGRFVFLLVEWVRKKPLKEGLEEKIDTVFFFILISIMALVTIKDIVKLF